MVTILSKLLPKIYVDDKAVSGAGLVSSLVSGPVYDALKTLQGKNGSIDSVEK